MGKVDEMLAEMRQERDRLAIELARAERVVNTVRVMLRRRDGRSTGISMTKDGKRWFVKQKRTKRRAASTSSEE